MIDTKLFSDITTSIKQRNNTLKSELSLWEQMFDWPSFHNDHRLQARSEFRKGLMDLIHVYWPVPNPLYSSLQLLYIRKGFSPFFIYLIPQPLICPENSDLGYYNQEISVAMITSDKPSFWTQSLQCLLAQTTTSIDASRKENNL